MNKKLFLCLSMFLIFGCAPTMTVRQEETLSIDLTGKTLSGPKRRVAVAEFENKTVYGQRRLGSSVSDILITELARTGQFILIEREKLEKVIAEQKMQLTGIVDETTVVQVGRILGVNTLIMGSVSQFGVKIESADFLIGQTKEQVAEATVDVRVVDVETGKILYADSGKGSVRKSVGQFLGLGTTAGYDETLEGEALRAAIKKFIENLVTEINKSTWFCRVAEVDGEKIYLTVGSDSRLDIGTELNVYRLGKEIKDPVTREVIGQSKEWVGKIKILQYFGQNSSIAGVTEGSIPRPGDICTLPTK